jgi:hypothetical protein
MTEEEVEAIYKKLEDTADTLSEFGEDVLCLLIIQHEPDPIHPQKTRQLLYAGKGNYWARIGMAQDYVTRLSQIPTVDPDQFADD